MNPFKNSKNHSEENLNDSEALEATELVQDSLDDETGLVAGEVSEIAHDNASENKAQSAGQKSQAQQSTQKKEAALSESLALRERLLATAPREPLMRNQVKQVLLKEKEKLESDVQKYSKKHNYMLLTTAIAELRAVIHQLEELAHASYEALKDIWLRVVHRFA